MFEWENQGLRPTGINPRPVRIGLVASSLRLGGAEKQTVYMARALLNSGIDLEFFYLGGGGYYEAVLRKTGVSVRQIYTPNRPGIMLGKLIAALRQFRPDIVLASQFGDLLHGAIAGRLCNGLTLGSVRSDGLRELKAHGRLSSSMIRLAHGLIANSYQAKQNLVSRGVKSQKLEVLPNVIDLADFDAQSALPPGIALPSNRVIVLAVGSLQACKRFDRFISALALARQRESALMGIIAGADYGAKAELQRQAGYLGLAADDLVFLGQCERIPALLARAAYLVLSSDAEGFPNVILEAMAARLPVITTAAGDAGVVVQHGKTGYVVEREDRHSMVEFMVRLAQSPSLRLTFGEAGRKRVEQEYNYELLSCRLLEVFHRFARQLRRTDLVEMLERGVAANRTEPLAEALLL